MTQLDASYWLAGAYYIEWDQQGELRIAGPDNHLYYGSIGLDRTKTTIGSVEAVKGELVLELDVAASSLLLADPAMGLHSQGTGLHRAASREEADLCRG